MKSALRHSRILLLCALCSFPAFSQETTTALSDTARWASTVAEQYWIQPDITYGVANNYTLKLDVWQRKDAKTAAPTLIYYHGGGWVFGDRTGATLLFLPYLRMGWNVINVEYRMANVSLAPAAVEDCRCALRWTVRNAKHYNIDTDRIVLTGHSAGGHLSLITGMLPEGTGLDNSCDGAEKLRVAAIINWYGISDVSDLVQGRNRRDYAVMWMGSQPDPLMIAKRVSPLTYVRAGLPRS
jgi:acetyl esterase/lipase